MTQPPEWATAIPAADGIRRDPTEFGGELTKPFTQQQLLEIGAEFLEQFLRRVVQAVAGVFIPGSSSFEQLQEWAQEIPIIGEIFGAFEDFGDFLQGLIDGSVLVNVTGLFGQLPSAFITDEPENLQIASGFTGPDSLTGNGIWSWDDTFGRTAAGSARVVADGALKALRGNDAEVQAGHTVEPECWVFWDGVSASGSAFELQLQALDAGTWSTVATASVSSPPAASADHPDADADGWVQLSVEYEVPPEDVTRIRKRLVVTADVAAGTVHFDDAPTTVSGGWLPDSLSGLEDGIENVGELVQDVIDFATSGLANTGETLAATLSQLAAYAQQVASDVFEALGFGVDNSNVLNIQTNKPVFAGLDSTAEATFDLTSFPEGSTLPSTEISEGDALAGFVRCSKKATKGFVKFHATGTSDDVRVNVYAVDSDGDMTSLWSSENLATQVFDATWEWVRALISGGEQVPVAASDLVMVEIVNAGTGTLSVSSRTVPSPTDATALPRNVGTSRDTGSTGGATPAALTDADVTYSGTMPFASFGVSNVPDDYHAPQSEAFRTAGAHTFTVPDFLRDGDAIDLVVLGGGGGGGHSIAFTSGQGGYHAEWVSTTLIKGTDFASDATELDVTVGDRGDGGTAGHGSGFDGGDSIVAYSDTSQVEQQVVSEGGPHGGPGPSHNPDNPNGTSQGIGPGNHTHNGLLYVGGTNVNAGGTGHSPGGGGGGAIPYFNGLPGGIGAVWVVARQVNS